MSAGRWNLSTLQLKFSHFTPLPAKISTANVIYSCYGSTRASKKGQQCMWETVWEAFSCLCVWSRYQHPLSLVNCFLPMKTWVREVCGLLTLEDGWCLKGKRCQLMMSSSAHCRGYSENLCDSCAVKVWVDKPQMSWLSQPAFLNTGGKNLFLLVANVGACDLEQTNTEIFSCLFRHKYEIFKQNSCMLGMS